MGLDELGLVVGAASALLRLVGPETEASRPGSRLLLCRCLAGTGLLLRVLLVLLMLLRMALLLVVLRERNLLLLMLLLILLLREGILLLLLLLRAARRWGNSVVALTRHLCGYVGAADVLLELRSRVRVWGFV